MKVDWHLICAECGADKTWSGAEHTLNEQVGLALRWESAHDCGVELCRLCNAPATVYWEGFGHRWCSEHEPDANWIPEETRNGGGGSDERR